ncbi:MAG: hypothetical protein HYY06_07175 [Deltaproteobacteria bacterium]|nr:hypothetical protein [Deltaproteobacteria bacterium]
MPARVLLIVLAAGCCGDDELPPWERDGGRPDGRVATRHSDAAADFTPVDAVTDLAGARTVLTLGGAEVRLGSAARAWLEADVDGDGDDDALILVEETTEREGDAGVAAGLKLVAYRRDGSELAAVGAEPLPEELAGGCTLDETRLRLEAPAAFSLWTRMRCPDGPRSFAAIGEVGPPPRFRFAARADGEARVSIAASDRDGDGQVDGTLSVGLRGAAAEIVYLDRAAGPSVDPATPERSLAPLVPARRAPDAISRARTLIDLRALLCGGQIDGGHLWLGGGPARECRPSRAAGRAISVLVGALVEAGRIPEAREAMGALEMQGIALGEEGRSALERKLASRVDLVLEPTHTIGPAVQTGASPPLRRSLRFLDDDRIAVASTPPFTYFVSSGQSAPGEPFEDRVLSPDGRRLVLGIARICTGHVASLATEGDFSTIPIASDGLPAGHPGCEHGAAVPDSASAAPHQVFPGPRADLDILGWRAPGGLVVLDGPKLREVPVDDHGEPGGRPHDLTPPTELPPGSPLGAGGRRQALGSAAGLWVRDGDHWALLPAASVGGPWSEVRAIAMSPSGDAVAGIRAGHIEVVTLRAPAAPVPAGP